jgi:L-ascorbate metabolism protein UlaG (beta-lactamase superfamily)
MFSIENRDESLFRLFFTQTPPPPYQPYRGTGIRWRYFGHACVLIETKDTSILFDPVLSYTYDSKIARYTYRDLPDSIDYVVISHNHIDHILYETMLQLRHKVKHIVVPRAGGGALHDPSLYLTLKNCGFANVIELGEMESISGRFMTLTGIPFLGEHGDLAIGSKLAYRVETHRGAFLFVADSCNVEPQVYEHVHALCGDADALFIGMECNGAPVSWMYGALMLQRMERAMDESRRLSGSDCAQAMGLVKIFNAKSVYVYAMGQEPWLNYVMSIKYTDASKPIVESNRLLAECRAMGVVAERLFGEKEIVLN